MKSYTPFILSLLLHFTVLLSVLYSQSLPKQSMTGHPPSAEGEIIPKQVEVELIEAPIVKNEELPELVVPELLKKKEKKGITECEDDAWYGGIGIQQDPMSGRLDQVYEGYPAWKAGLKPGDYIQESSDGEIRGEPGTELILNVLRPSTGEVFILKLVRERICYGSKR